MLLPELLDGCEVMTKPQPGRELYCSARSGNPTPVFLHVLELAELQQGVCALLCEANICSAPLLSHEPCLYIQEHFFSSMASA